MVSERLADEDYFVHVCVFFRCQRRARKKRNRSEAGSRHTAKSRCVSTGEVAFLKQHRLKYLQSDFPPTHQRPLYFSKDKCRRFPAVIAAGKTQCTQVFSARAVWISPTGGKDSRSANVPPQTPGFLLPCCLSAQSQQV